MDFSPQNTASQFTTKLSEVVELEGKWEVGLLETSFPGKVVNVFGGKFSYSVHKIAQQRIDCILNDGIYPSIVSVLHEMKRAWQRATNPSKRRRRDGDERAKQLVTFEYSARSGRVSFTFTATAHDVVAVSFSSDLAVMLGYEADRQYVHGLRNVVKAEKPIHLSAKINNVYIYCDLLEHVLVGDTKTPLLRIVNRKTDVRRLHDSVEHVTFNPVQYVPLQKKCFDTVSIQMMTDFGQPMPFVPGKSLVVLEFRRMAHPYLLL